MLCDQDKYANTEDEVQMGTTRADGSRRLDEEAWNSVTMLRLLRDGVLSIVDEDRELAMRKVYRETHKRNPRPHRQLEQAQTVRSWHIRGCQVLSKGKIFFDKVGTFGVASAS